MNNTQPNYEALKKNICYVIKEQHIKLGYTKDSSSGPWLYYPLNALNNLLGTQHSVEEMLDELTEFVKYSQPEFGPANISNKAERFCFKLAAQASDYVYENVPDEPFLEELVTALANHASLEDVLTIFKKYAADEEDIVIEESPSDEFDKLVYFRSGEPDPFIYCLADEMGHITYHRLTREDLSDRL